MADQDDSPLETYREEGSQSLKDQIKLLNGQIAEAYRANKAGMRQTWQQKHATRESVFVEVCRDRLPRDTWLTLWAEVDQIMGADELSREPGAESRVG